MASRRTRGGGRIQGGWATNNATTPIVPTLSTVPTPRLQAAGTPTVTYLKSEEPFPSTSTTKAAKVPKPLDITLKTPGECILSRVPSGISKLHFFPEFLGKEDADAAFAVLSEDITWKQTNDRHGGKNPRLTCWYGDYPYAYSGISHPSNPTLHPVIEDIKVRIESVTERSFNSVLCNLYRNNHDSVDWHSDNERSLGTNPYIASVSLGDVRVFELRQKAEKSDDSQIVRVHLPHGSLLIMEGCVQEDWEHRLRKEYHDRTPRINLTFRTIFPS